MNATQGRHIGLNCRQSEGCGLFFGKFPHQDIGKSSDVLFVSDMNSHHQLGGCLVLPMQSLIHSPRHSTRSGIVLHLGQALLAAMVNGAVLALGWAPPGGVECHLSVSLFSVICVLVTEGGRQMLSITPPVGGIFSQEASQVSR